MYVCTTVTRYRDWPSSEAHCFSVKLSVAISVGITLYRLWTDCLCCFLQGFSGALRQSVSTLGAAKEDWVSPGRKESLHSDVFLFKLWVNKDKNFVRLPN